MVAHQAEPRSLEHGSGILWLVPTQISAILQLLVHFPYTLGRLDTVEVAFMDKSDPFRNRPIASLRNKSNMLEVPSAYPRK